MIQLPLLLADAYQYVPFKTPLPAWNYWYLLAIPLCLGISIVYKAIRSDSMRGVAREALILCGFILAVMVLAGAALAGLVTLLE